MLLHTKINPELKKALDAGKADDEFDILILIRPTPRDLLGASFPSDGCFTLTNDIKADLLDKTIKVHQKPLIDRARELKIVYETFWINNVLRISATLEKLSDFFRTDFPVSDDYIESIAFNLEFSYLLSIKELLAVPRAKDCIMAASVPYPQWNLQQIGSLILNAAPFHLNGKGALIAVIDTGIDYQHPDLKSHMWDGGHRYPHHGYNFGDGNDDPMDATLHGTHCASIIAGDGACGQLTGVAFGAKLMALRIYSKERKTTQGKMWKAMMFALKHRCDIISMSQSCDYNVYPSHNAWRRACETIQYFHVFHVNTAGNNGCSSKKLEQEIPNNCNPPGNCPPPWLHPIQTLTHRGGSSSCITVGAVNVDNYFWIDSSYGSCHWLDYPYDASTGRGGLIKPDLCAPGLDVTVCDPITNSYSLDGGTSMAAPHVSGSAALLLQAIREAGKFDRKWVEKIFIALSCSARPIQGQTQPKENKYGAGAINVYHAWLFGRNQGWW
ncbi:MAG: S8 family serine peptidase [Gemmatales bacterium]